MKKLVITLPKMKYADYVLVNGENVIFKHNKKAKIYYAEYETEDDKVNISFDTYNPLNRWHWWLLGTLFFIITILGILDWHLSSKFIYNYQSTITLNEGDNFIKLIPLKGKGPVLKVETSCPYEETVNQKDRPKKIKRRSALLTLTKVFVILCVVAGLVFLFVMMLVAFLNHAANPNP